MKKKECPSCAMPIDEKSTVCPICGFEFPKTQSSIQWVAIVLLILFLLMLFRGIWLW